MRKESFVISLPEILHELVDAVHMARTITDNRRGELHQAVNYLEKLISEPIQPSASDGSPATPA